MQKFTNYLILPDQVNKYFILRRLKNPENFAGKVPKSYAQSAQKKISFPDFYKPL